MKLFILKYKPVFKAKFSLLFMLGLLFGTNIFSQQSEKYPIIRTPDAVSVNKELPKDILPDTEAIPVSFSKNPTDEEIYAVHFFEEPLVPAKGIVSAEENKDFVYALINYSQRTIPDDFAALNSFLEKYPKSRWQGSLLSSMGIVYRRSGYYSKAMEAWEKAWELLKGESEVKIKTLADRVVSELLMINSWVGRVERMESLVNEINDRLILGTAVERVASARAALITMKARPGVSYKCGPFALEMVSRKDSGKVVFNKKIYELESPARGFSLSELEVMSVREGMKYQMAFRKPGAPVILKAVVHWKLNHYSALLKANKGNYMCEDVTLGTMYGKQFWLTSTALDSSASGYFLVPEGPLPEGWRKVTVEEGAEVFGKGNEIPDNGKHVGEDDNQFPKCPGSTPMAQSNVHTLAVSLHIFDRPAYYTPPKGPAMLWDVDYHQRDSYQPANFTYSNFGPKWTFKWLSYITDNPNNPTANADLYAMRGGTRTFVLFDTAKKSYAPEVQTNDVLVRICPNCYELRHPNGSKEVYARSDGNTSNGRKIFLTEIIDPAGNKITLTYDANLRITSLKDALNQVTTVTYGNSDIYKVTKVTDPFGRFATFSYDASGRLSSITDMIGIVSTFQYNASDFINSMTTPYGTTSFVASDVNSIRSLETHYPLGEQERVEYRENAPGINMTEDVAPSNAYNTYLVYRNTFVWDKQAMKVAPGDYTKAMIYHWLHGSYLSGENGVAAPMLESIKMPLERREWYSYQGQTSGIFANQGMSAKPSIIARILDDGREQKTLFSYNSIGNVVSSTDPSGRKFTYVYDSTNINLLEVRQTRGSANELVSQFTYNNIFLPLTSRDASGLVTTYTYNAEGQLLTVKNAKNETTTFTYNTNGYLLKISGPVAGSTLTIGYDGYGRVRSVTDPEGYKITTDYDALDRPTLITYPDNGFEQIVYDRLDAVHQRDRLGRWSHSVYDSLRRKNAFIDALGRITQFIWCNCGSISEIIDPLKNITTFTRDLQGRVITKTYNNGKSTSYVYEKSTSKLKQVTDAKGQKKIYTYNIDGTMKSVAYLNATIATRGVSYTYDTSYNRIRTMMDAIGATTYSYKNIGMGLGSGMLASVDGPLTNDLVTYGYDSLARISSRSINGVNAITTFDNLGRKVAETNALGTFNYDYLNQTSRLSSMSYPNGQTTVYSYYPNIGDQRLKQIWNRNSVGSTLSKFNYEYDVESQLSKWTQQADSTDISYDDISYNLADELIAATKRNQNPGAVIKRYAFQYDKAGNRTSEQIDNNVTSYAYNNINQLTVQSNGGPIHMKGTLSEVSTVKLENLTSNDSAMATVDSIAKTFDGFIRTLPGTSNRLRVTATDFSGNNNTTVFNDTILTGNGVSSSYTYDNNGNMLTASNPGVAYSWDAEDRLVKITKGNAIIEFMYDGLNRRVAEKLNGTIIKRWLWDGDEVVEERDASGSKVTKRFFAQGEIIGAVKYFFTKDHIGSIRDVTDAAGVLMARYTYDPYGRRTRLAGTIDVDFGFTGYYYHAASGLYLTLYRAYDANTGRWLSRDPIGEAAGYNLFMYANNNPYNFIDPLGQSWLSVVGYFVAGVAVGAAVAAVIIVAAPIVASVGAAGLVAAGVSAATASTIATATVTTALGVGAVVGGISTANSLYNNASSGNWDCFAYTLGTLGGGIIVGGAGGGRYLANNLNPSGVRSSVPPSWNPFTADKGYGYVRNPNLPFYQDFYNLMGTGPTPSSGGGSAASISSGFSPSPCGCK